MNDSTEDIGCFEVHIDRYNGVTIKDESIPKDIHTFETNLNLLIQTAKETNRKLIWIYLDIAHSYLVPITTSFGFSYHTCEDNKLLLVKTLIENSIIPTAANHTLGVGVVVINERNELLAIKERFSNIGFKLPGGHIDDAELIQTAVIREVKEETGIDVAFKSIISLGHFYPHQFNKSNLYILCTAQALSYDIKIEDTQEIIDCQWIDVNDYLEDESVFEFNKLIVKAALGYKGFESYEMDILKKIPKENYELFFPKKTNPKP